MSQHDLDEAIAKVRSQQPDSEMERSAVKRVFSHLFDTAFISAPEPAGKLRGCADMRSLIPAYLDRTLAPARVLLLEDHTLHCIDCRRALREARMGEASAAPVVSMSRGASRRIPVWTWAVAATAVIAAGLGIVGLLPGQNPVRATVASVQGALYKVSDIGLSLVEAGEIIKNSDELRTAKGSRAIIRLAGGAQLELAERSEISFGRNWRGATTINLERGRMIADSPSARDAFFVTSGDLTTPVRASLISFNSGIKASRIAIARGGADIELGGQKRVVAAGKQLSADLRPVNLPIANEFAWSQNSADYLALLSQISALQKDLQAIPSPGLRYESKLAAYLPADTMIYAAIPNLGGTITEAKRLFDSRLAESEVLRQWWSQQPISKNGEFDRMIERLGSFSSYLGNEVVIAVDASGKAPVVLAQITKPGLSEEIARTVPAGAHVQIVSADHPASPSEGLLLQLDHEMLVAAFNTAQLNRVESAIAAGTASPGFSQSPMFGRVAQIYHSGAGYFLTADLEQIHAKSVSTAKAKWEAGFDNVQYLVLESKQISQNSDMRASLTFNGARHGVASWLSQPSPAGSLDFVSPEASFAASFVMKNPSAMLTEMLSLAGANSELAKNLQEFQNKSGLSVQDDIASPLGGDVTVALDGPIVPLPAWKVAIEVYDKDRLQQTVQTLVDRFNQQVPENAGKLTLSDQTVDGRLYHVLVSCKAAGLPVYYTFVDGYLLASSSQANIATAIQNKQARHVLAQSQAFRDKLPNDGQTNYSGLIYNNLGSTLGGLASAVKTQQPSVVSSLLRSGAGLICIYGESDLITAAARGSFLGFDLSNLIALQEGQSVKTLTNTPSSQPVI